MPAPARNSVCICCGAPASAGFQIPDYRTPDRSLVAICADCYYESDHAAINRDARCGAIWDPDHRYTEAVRRHGSGGRACKKVGESIPSLQDCGFELEFVSRRNLDVEDYAAKFQEEHPGLVASFEDDASLDCNGAEIVSHYGPIDETAKALKLVCDSLSINKCKSHNTSCCGLHISISRDGLTMKHIARYVVFWNSPHNKQFLHAFARRWDGDFAKSKAQKSQIPAWLDSPLPIPLLYTSESRQRRDFLRNEDRYELVNLQNSNRIEIRAFKGTTIYQVAMACMSLSVWLMSYCKTDGPLCFEDFLKWCRTTKATRGDESFTPKEIVNFHEIRGPKITRVSRRSRDGRFISRQDPGRPAVGRLTAPIMANCQTATATSLQFSIG